MTERCCTWPRILGGLLLLFAVLIGWSIHRASRSGTLVAVPGYVSGNFDPDAEAAAEAAAAREGWHLEYAGVRDGVLRVRLRDGDREPVRSARITLRRWVPHQGAWHATPLAEADPGHYTAIVADLESAERAQLEIRKGPARRIRDLLLNPIAGPASGPATGARP